MVMVFVFGVGMVGGKLLYFLLHLNIYYNLVDGVIVLEGRSMFFVMKMFDFSRFFVFYL